MKKFIAGLCFLFVCLLLAALATAYIATQLREQKTIEAMASVNPGIFVQTRDAKVFLQDVGPKNGSAVILIHGMGARSELWRSTIDALTQNGFRVLAFDIPPFGFSEKLQGAASYKTQKQAARILDVLNALHVKQTSLVCHSIGCRVGTETLLQSPKTFNQALMIDPVLGFAPDQVNFHFQQNDPNALVKAVLSPIPIRDAILGVYGVNPLSIKPIFRAFVYDAACVNDQSKNILEQPMFINNMTRSFGDWLQNLLAEPDDALYTNFQNYRKLSLPILVVWGRQDTTTPLWQGEALQHLFPQAQLRIMENTGHMPYIEKPAEFNTLLLAFLKVRQ